MALQRFSILGDKRMNKYEELIAEYSNIKIEEEPMRHEGLYCDGNIWIKKDMPTLRKACVLAEEIGHHETTTGVILDQRKIDCMIQESHARQWAYKRMVPLKDIYMAFGCGYGQPYEMAEFLQVDEAFLVECLKSYGFM
jgi:hypothetical protein